MISSLAYDFHTHRSIWLTCPCCPTHCKYCWHKDTLTGGVKLAGFASCFLRQRMPLVTDPRYHRLLPTYKWMRSHAIETPM